MPQLQALLDRSFQLPQWAGLALLALAAVVTIPGRHGQRPLNAALLGVGGGALVFQALRLHPWLPGVGAIVTGVLLALFGLVAVGWATALLTALLFAGGGFLIATALHVVAVPIALAAFGLGLFVGLVNHRALSLVYPPIFSALFAAVGAAVAWAPNKRGAKLVQLLDVRWTLGLAGLLAIALLILSFERDFRARKRFAAREKHLAEQKLQAELAARAAKYQRAMDQAEKP